MLNNINTPSLALLGCKAGCNSYKTLIFNVCCGETGIRTPGSVTFNGFQDRRNRPLCHLSKTPLSEVLFVKSGAKVRRYFKYARVSLKKISHLFPKDSNL